MRIGKSCSPAASLGDVPVMPTTKLHVEIIILYRRIDLSEV